MAVINRVLAERERQELLYATGELPSISSAPDCPTELRLAALVEEVGEVGKAILESGDLESELIQVAAVAIAWLEGIDQ